MDEITIKDIARLSGVGISTVSRAINNHPDINPETKDKVMKVIKEYNYIPNNSARNLKRLESRTIAVLMKGISNPFFLSLLLPLEEFVEKKHYDYILQRVGETEDEISIALQLEKEKRLRGIIFLGGNFDRAQEKLSKLKTPFVLCTLQNLDGVDLNSYSSVSIDDFKESYRMTEYLLGLGHERIAVVCGRQNDVSISHWRLEGYKEALQAHGIAYDPALVFPMKKDYVPYSMSNGYVVMKEALKAEKEFTAVYAFSDEMAIGASKAILDSGKRIPKDYSVVGFDGTQGALYYHPSIATVKQPGDQMILEAARILFELISGRGKNQHKTFEAEMIIGQSTGKR